MIPLLLEGQDVVGIAQTGTGKTAAFMLPLLTKLHELQRRPQKGKCDVLVLTPTRELANQILENARLYGKDIKFSACLIVGGARYEGQLRSLAKGVNLIVATPGRLMDHMETGAVDLSEVSYVVLDEADQMLDMGFIPAVRTIMKDVPEARQTVMTSATMPQQVEKLAREMMINPARVAVSKQSEPAKNIKQHILFVDKPQKPKALLATLSQSDWDKVIIFTRTKRGADKTQVQLIKAGYMAQSLHGDKSFGQRRHVLEEFKSGEVPILVATDLAGRGLDIDDISLVVNYDIPNIAESYVHRIGRTGRAGRKGIAISLVDRSEKSYLKEIEKLMGMNLRDAAGKGPIDLSIEPAALPQGQLADKPYRADKPSARAQNQLIGKSVLPALHVQISHAATAMVINSIKVISVINVKAALKSALGVEISHVLKIVNKQQTALRQDSLVKSHLVLQVSRVHLKNQIKKPKAVNHLAHLRPNHMKSVNAQQEMKAIGLTINRAINHQERISPLAQAKRKAMPKAVLIKNAIVMIKKLAQVA